MSDYRHLKIRILALKLLTVFVYVTDDGERGLFRRQFHDQSFLQ